MDYTSESIYWVNFSDSRRIDTVRDLEFDEDNSFEEMGTTVAKVYLFSFSKLDFFTDITFNTSVREEEDLPATPSTPSVAHPIIEYDSDQLSLSFLNDNSPPL